MAPTDAQVFQAYGSIEGVLTDDGLTVSLYVPDSGLKRFCPRFKDQELQITGEIPGNIHQLYDGFAGVTIEGLRVVIETHRCCTADSQVNASARKRFYRHALICSGLSHTNIVPFLGVFSSDKFPYACVFESVGKETIPQYLVNNPGSSRLKLLVEVARGLHHIHELDIVHGSIKGTNICIDGKGIARIAGFASATPLMESYIASGVDESTVPAMSRWCSPEILRPSDPGLTKAKATKASDIYAFGMLAYEIFSGRLPFYDERETAAVFRIMTTHDRPSRPSHQQLSDKIWGLIEECWSGDPSQRPKIQEVVAFLEKS